MDRIIKIKYTKFKDLKVGDTFILKHQLPCNTVGIGGGPCVKSTVKPIYKKISDMLNDKYGNAVAINTFGGLKTIGPNKLTIKL